MGNGCTGDCANMAVRAVEEPSEIIDDYLDNIHTINENKNKIFRRSDDNKDLENRKRKKLRVKNTINKKNNKEIQVIKNKNYNNEELIIQSDENSTEINPQLENLIEVTDMYKRTKEELDKLKFDLKFISLQLKDRNKECSNLKESINYFTMNKYNYSELANKYINPLYTSEN